MLAGTPALCATFAQLYAFQGGTDGVGPDSLAVADGMLIGTTGGGGDPLWQAGTAFSLTLAGAHTVLHRFAGHDDGDIPNSIGLIHGTIYGTADYFGGTRCGVKGGCGSIFALSADGSDSIIAFYERGKAGIYDGAGVGLPIPYRDRLHGVTRTGGDHDYGTIFRVTSEGHVATAYSFGGAIDGAGPVGGLVEIGGVLYGATYGGGGVGCGGYGCGTIFSFSQYGEQVIYRFQGGADGAHPQGSMIAYHGDLYGTTANGGGYIGRSANQPEGSGTVFKMTTAGSETILHAFRGGPDGQTPTARLARIGDTLYGTTTLGGTHVCIEWGCGTVFGVTTRGREKVLYDFTGGDDGYGPDNMVTIGGALYGSTSDGGVPGSVAYNGTVFSIVP
jgi:uncharacterized repeat protein (TIGR03803 family)